MIRVLLHPAGADRSVALVAVGSHLVALSGDVAWAGDLFTKLFSVPLPASVTAAHWRQVPASHYCYINVDVGDDKGQL